MGSEARKSLQAKVARNNVVVRICVIDNGDNGVTMMMIRFFSMAIANGTSVLHTLQMWLQTPSQGSELSLVLPVSIFVPAAATPNTGTAIGSKVSSSRTNSAWRAKVASGA